MHYNLLIIHYEYFAFLFINILAILKFNLS